MFTNFISVSAFSHVLLFRSALWVSFLLLFGHTLVISCLINCSCMLESQLNHWWVVTLKRRHVDIGFFVTAEVLISRRSTIVYIGYVMIIAIPHHPYLLAPLRRNLKVRCHRLILLSTLDRADRIFILEWATLWRAWIAHLHLKAISVMSRRRTCVSCWDIWDVFDRPSVPVRPWMQLAFRADRRDTSIGFRSIVKCRRFAIHQIQALVVEIHCFSLVNDLAFIFFIIFRDYLMLLLTATIVCRCGDS